MTDGEGQRDRRHAYRAVGYIPADTFLHRMDPRTKLLTVLAISIAAFATISPLRTAILFASSSALRLLQGS